jgi:hypothetical protein
MADAVQGLNVNRNCIAAVTALRRNVNSSCDIAAKYRRLGGHPTASESKPVQVEEDNQVATDVVCVTALACDVANLVLNFHRSPARTWPTQFRSRR